MVKINIATFEEFKNDIQHEDGLKNQSKIGDHIVQNLVEEYKIYLINGIDEIIQKSEDYNFDIREKFMKYFNMVENYEN